ncbi:MAG: hypothetical protein RBS57_20280 [Desulforhabdus sp.]|jgi:hypothetical protein|nr:hypothetical protein [Desulforhabdus sp.]
MSQEQLVRDWLELPPTAQQAVVDFIAFLRARYTLTPPPQLDVPCKLSEEPFVGMWQDRTDMEDSTQWVRTIRTQEWD